MAIEILQNRFTTYSREKLQPYESKSYVLVETLNQLEQVKIYLEPFNIVGVDLENYHQGDSYNGFTCLI